MKYVLALVLVFAAGCDSQKSSSLPAEGQWRLINYWALWCTPCREEIPELNNIDSAADITVLGVNYDEQKGEALGRQRSEMGITFANLPQDPATTEACTHRAGAWKPILLAKKTPAISRRKKEPLKSGPPLHHRKGARRMFPLCHPRGGTISAAITETSTSVKSSQKILFFYRGLGPDRGARLSGARRNPQFNLYQAFALT